MAIVNPTVKFKPDALFIFARGIMRYPSLIDVVKVEQLLPREGFAEPSHRVTFSLVSEGIPASEMSVWVHPAFPEAELIRVARTFLWSRLVAWSEAANADRFSEAEIQALWERVEPQNFAAN
ncbi:MAG: hypothetical protein AAF622_00925 [Cyanobacteria bacterium P01_C01_bin.147]